MKIRIDKKRLYKGYIFEFISNKKAKITFKIIVNELDIVGLLYHVNYNDNKNINCNAHFYDYKTARCYINTLLNYH